MIKPYPVVELASACEPSPRFGRWAAAFGIFRLARSLGVTNRCVRAWLHSSVTPRPEKVRQIIVLSRHEPLDGEPLTYEDLYGSSSIGTVEMRTVRKVQDWE